MVVEKEKFDTPVADGIVTWWEIDEKGEKHLLCKHNTVLNTARFIMRDLLAGGNDTINKVLLGDRNLTFDDNLNMNPPMVSPTETVLAHQIGEVMLLQTDKAEVSGRPSVIFTFKVVKDNSLGSADGSAIIAECGLCTKDNRMFSKVAHKPIIKRPFAGLLLQWEIIF